MANQYYRQQTLDNYPAFDRILENKVDFGSYQKRALIILSFIDFNDGAELIFMSLIVQIIKIEYNLPSETLQNFASLFYFGMFIGAFTSGKVSDQYGRKIAIIYSSLFQGILALSFIFVSSVQQLFILRFIYGIVYGFSLPISTTLYSEITPLSYRGKGIVVINSAVGIGKLWGVIIAALILTDVHSGNWKLMMAFSSIPCFIVFLNSIIYLLESPRYLISCGRYNQGQEILNTMIEINKGMGGDVINDEDMEDLTKWKNQTFIDDEQGNPKALFNRENYKVTIKLWVLWFLYHIMSKGQLLILPFILSKKEENGFTTMFIAVLGEIPAMVLSYFIIGKHLLINNKDLPIFGRKKTMVFFFTAMAIFNAMCFENIFLGMSLAATRFCFREVSTMIYAYTTEYYKTSYRTLGIGWASGMGRLGTCIMPYILFPIFDIGTFYPFLAFTFFSIICVYSSITLPFDTTGKTLDNQPDEEFYTNKLSEMEMPILK